MFIVYTSVLVSSVVRGRLCRTCLTVRVCNRLSYCGRVKTAHIKLFTLTAQNVNDILIYSVLISKSFMMLKHFMRVGSEPRPVVRVGLFVRVEASPLYYHRGNSFMISSSL